MFDYYHHVRVWLCSLNVLGLEHLIELLLLFLLQHGEEMVEGQQQKVIFVFGE